MRYFKTILAGYIAAVGTGSYGEQITMSEYTELMSLIKSSPVAPEGYAYMLRADTLEWELVEVQPVPEPEPTADEALTRYANELTGENDPDLVSATETLIKHFTEE